MDGDERGPSESSAEAILPSERRDPPNEEFSVNQLLSKIYPTFTAKDDSKSQNQQDSVQVQWWDQVAKCSASQDDEMEGTSVNQEQSEKNVSDVDYWQAEMDAWMKKSAKLLDNQKRWETNMKSFLEEEKRCEQETTKCDVEQSSSSGDDMIRDQNTTSETDSIVENRGSYEKLDPNISNAIPQSSNENPSKEKLTSQSRLIADLRCKSEKEKGDVEELPAKLLQAKGKAVKHKVTNQQSVISRLIEKNTQPEAKIGEPSDKVKSLLSKLEQQHKKTTDMTAEWRNTRRKALEYKGSKEVIELSLAKSKAEQEHQDAVKELQARLLEVKGNAVKHRATNQKSVISRLIENNSEPEGKIGKPDYVSKSPEDRKEDPENTKLETNSKSFRRGLDTYTAEQRGPSPEYEKEEPDTAKLETNSKNFDKGLNTCMPEKRELDDKVKTLLDKLEQKHKKTADMTVELTNARREALEYKSSKEAIELMLAQSKAEQEHQDDRVNILLEQLEEQKRITNDLESKLAVFQNEALDYKASKEKIESSLIKSAEEQEALNAQIETLSAQLTEQKLTTSALEADLACAQRVALESKFAKDQATANLADSVEAQKKLDQAAKSLLAQLEEQLRITSETEAKLIESQNETMKYVEANTKHETELLELQAKQEKAELEIDQMRVLLEEQKQSVHEAEQQAEEMKAEVSRYKEANEKAEMKVTIFAEELKEKDDKAEQLRIQLEKQKRTENDLKARLADLQYKVLNVESATKKAEARAEELEEENGLYCVELEWQKNATTQIEQLFTEAKDQVVALEDSMKETEMKLIELKQDKEMETNQLRASLEEQENAMEDLKKKLEDAEAQVIGHKEASEQVKKEWVLLKEVLEDTEKKSENMRSLMVKEKNISVETTKQLNTELMEQKEATRNAEEKLADAKVEIIKYKDYSKTWEMEFVAFKEELKEKNDKTEQLLIQIEKLKRKEARCLEVEEEKVKLLDQLDEKNQTIKESESQLAEAYDKAAKYMEANEETLQKLMDLNAEYETKTVEIEQLRAELQEQKRIVNYTEAQLNCTENSVDKYKRSYEEAQTKWNLFKEEQEEKDKKNAKLQIDLEEQTASTTDLKAKLEDALMKGNEYELRNKDAENKITELTTSLEEAEGKVSNLLSKLMEQKEKTCELEANLQDVIKNSLEYNECKKEREAKSLDLEAEKKQNDQEIEHLRTQLEGEMSSSKDLHVKLASAQEELSKYRKTNDEVVKSFAELKSSHSTIDGENKLLRNRIMALEHAVSPSKQENKDEIEKLKRYLTLSQTTLMQSQKTLRNTQANLEVARKQAETKMNRRISEVKEEYEQKVKELEEALSDQTKNDDRAKNDAETIKTFEEALVKATHGEKVALGRVADLEKRLTRAQAQVSFWYQRGNVSNDGQKASNNNVKVSDFKVKQTSATE